MTSMGVFQQVAAGELSSDQGAAALAQVRKEDQLRSLVGLPRWVVVVMIIVAAIILPSLLGPRNNQRA
jgi:hypothetical protein